MSGSALKQRKDKEKGAKKTMSEIKLNVPESALVPENDLQELWMLNGRVEALRGLIESKESKQDSDPLFYASDIKAIMGW